MQLISNPEQFELNPSFMSKSLKNKLKPISSKDISNYSIRQKIGMGSYAKVYKATHKPTGQQVAVKILNKTRMSKQEIDKTYYQVQTQKQLFHTNIARIYQFYQNDQKIYIFMQLCQNGQLFNYINTKGPLSQKFCSKIFTQLLSALKYLKSQRLFHRDIKCQNIMFDHNWNIKLVDFGFVTKEDDGCFSKTFCGSPSYTAPQLVKRQQYHSEMIDVWCLGVSLYAMITGELPFDENEVKDTRRNIVEIRYEVKSYFSESVKEVFSKIFVDGESRATIEELEQTDFALKSPSSKSNFINTNNEQITIDLHIMGLISAEFNINSVQIIDSVTKINLNHHYSLYYLTIQREILKGHKVKYDIASSQFMKKKKRSSTLKLIKIRDQSKKRITRLDLLQLEMPELKTKRETFRIRMNNPSVDVQQARLRKRDDSPDSPKRILDLVSAYRQRM